MLERRERRSIGGDLDRLFPDTLIDERAAARDLCALVCRSIRAGHQAIGMPWTTQSRCARARGAIAARYARWCFTRESWGQENTRDDGRFDAIRYDETRYKSGFRGILDEESVLNRHVSMVRIKRVNA